MKLCKALYGCLKSALLFYRKLWGNLHSNNFVMNPCDPRVCNKIIGGKQMTITWHVNHLKIAHATDAAITDVVTYLGKYTAH